MDVDKIIDSEDASKSVLNDEDCQRAMREALMAKCLADPLAYFVDHVEPRLSKLTGTTVRLEPVEMTLADMARLTSPEEASEAGDKVLAELSS